MVGKESRRYLLISRGGALHRKGKRNSRVLPPFPESPRKFLVGNFIGFPRKPSYSAFFLQLIFFLPYNFLISSYINKYTRLSTSSPSIRRIPWIQRGWTLAHGDIWGTLGMMARHWSFSRLSCGERLLLRCDGNTGNSFRNIQGKDT